MNYNFDPEKAYEDIKASLTKWADDTHAQNFVVGISGGKDSTVIAMLLQSIFGCERVYGVMMPNGTQKDIQDSKDVIRILGINEWTVNIGDAFNSIVSQLGDATCDCLTNLPARLRMSTLFAVAQCVNGRVINTDNLTESVLGYSTFGGDGFGCYAPIGNLTVTEVRELGKWMAHHVVKVFWEHHHIEDVFENEYELHEDLVRLEELVYKTPSDGLQPLSDEDKLGMKYADVDNLIRKNEATDELRAKVMARYKVNKFKTDIVRVPAPSHVQQSFLNYVTLQN